MQLGYWPIKARAAAIRLLLHHAGVSFEDKIVTSSEWAELKPELNKQAEYKYANLPFLKDGDKLFFESMAILRYVARKFDYIATNEADIFAQDMFQCVISGMDEAFYKARWMQPESGRKEALTKVANNHSQLAGIEEKLGKSKFLAGNEPTFVDFMLLAYGDMAVLWGSNLYEKFPNIVKHKERLMENEKMAAYYKSVEKMPPMPALDNFKGF